jgi:hypothetical protein
MLKMCGYGIIDHSKVSHIRLHAHLGVGNFLNVVHDCRKLEKHWLIEYNRSYLEAISFVCNLRMCHAMVTMDPLNMN